MDNALEKERGCQLFLMSLSQCLHEPLKIGLLEQAVVECNDVLSALVLADIYNSGIEHNGKIIIAANNEKAADIYKKMAKYDSNGVCDWQLGWFYENQTIDEAKSINISEALIIAKNYYEKSAEKNYAKAYNSLGKFSYYGLGGSPQDFTQALKFYILAANLGDIYGIMNCGLINMERYYRDTTNTNALDEAEQYFQKAAIYNNSEGLLQLGIINEIKMIKDPSFLNKAKEYYIKAIQTVENQYSASAYYKLAQLITNYEELKSDSQIIDGLGKRKYNDLKVECLNRAYKIFQDMDINNRQIKGVYKDYYDKIISMFNI